jgi:hypothetical protein
LLLYWWLSGNSRISVSIRFNTGLKTISKILLHFYYKPLSHLQSTTDIFGSFQNSLKRIVLFRILFFSERGA